MQTQNKFDKTAQLGFLKLLTKESENDNELDSETWEDWIAILHNLIESDDLLVSSDALKVLGALYSSHPDKMKDQTAPQISKFKLGRLMTTKSAQDQTNLIEFIFAVMLNNDKALRNDLNDVKKTLESNQLAMLEEVNELKYLNEAHEEAKTPAMKKGQQEKGQTSDVEDLKKNLMGIEEKVAKLMSSSVTEAAYGGHNV